MLISMHSIQLYYSEERCGRPRQDVARRARTREYELVHVTSETLRDALDLFHAQVCSSLLDINILCLGALDTLILFDNPKPDSEDSFRLLPASFREPV